MEGTVISTEVGIVNKRGLHARAAAKLVNLAEQFSANVEVAKDGQSVSARSIMGLMMLGAGIGSTVRLSAEGFDAKEALDAIAALIEAGFHETD
ncbi:HPr family phosphocarrier protein [Acidocella sp. KAb 2-4]|uniref:HPr family phosphocarrier protein n=1 Tax=Acidocella sp. KAb 2-4 TaxID=2885158 RepID=UPI001D089BD4|nr:HPr family phosphocarrier protein [Acidocella sp. KAb 2-4]MCB5944788.1 HPr family phosphocarrier protein [Acidocella sp. KAb 2-4]